MQAGLTPSPAPSCSHKMEANVTLHWFVHPRWFDLVGGFTKAENIKYFLDWAKLAFENFGEGWLLLQTPAHCLLSNRLSFRACVPPRDLAF